MEVGQSNISGTDTDDAEEDEAEGIWQFIHGANETSRISMAIQEINRQCQHKKSRSFNDEVMAQELYNGNTNRCKGDYTSETEKNSRPRLDIMRIMRII